MRIGTEAGGNPAVQTTLTPLGEGVSQRIDDGIVPANLVAEYLCLRSAGRATADAPRPGIFHFLIDGLSGVGLHMEIAELRPWPGSWEKYIVKPNQYQRHSLYWYKMY
jgi:hypothetical protein